MRPLIVIIAIIAAMYLVKVFVLDGDKPDGSVAGSTATTSSSKKSSLLPVDIYVAREVNQSNVVFATGTVIPNEEVEIKSEVSGRLIRLNIKEGSFIQKGQVVAKLDDADLIARLKRLKYEEELADQTEARQQKLLEINAISKEEYDMAVNKVNTLSADKELLQVQLERTTVKAPFSGRMGFKNISEGAYITPGVIIANLVQTNPAKLDFTLPEKYANKVKVGQSMTFTIDGDDEKLKGTVLAIDPKIDDQLRTLKVRARTDNRTGKLLPGMFIRAELPLGQEKSIMIPTQAVIPILKGKKVYVLKEGVATEINIKTGLRTDTEIQVVEGLMVGDSVVVSALMTVKNNMPLAVRNVID